MYPIIASIDSGFFQVLQLEGMDLSIILKFGLLRKNNPEIQYFHEENKKNIRLNIDTSFFFYINSICRQNHSCLNEYAGELIIEVFLDIIRYE